jgi:hypothetical protein
MTRSFALRSLFVAGVVGLAACSPASSAQDGVGQGTQGAQGAEIAEAAGGAYARPAALSEVPLVELVGPATTGAGPAPVFEWRPIDGASKYRLSVRGPELRSWAWAGAATSVRYGGVTEGQAGPTIIPGTFWSVAALGGDGSLLALSELRPVSPTDDAGPAPDWLAAPAPDAGTAPAPEEAQASPAGEFDACDLLSADEITAAIDGTWGAPVLAYGDALGGRCEWTSENGSILSIDLLPAATYDPEGWGADGTVDDLGERSYVVSHGWDRRIGFVRGERSVMLVIDWTRVDLEAFASIARVIEGRLP